METTTFVRLILAYVTLSFSFSALTHLNKKWWKFRKKYERNEPKQLGTTGSQEK